MGKTAAASPSQQAQNAQSNPRSSVMAVKVIPPGPSYWSCDFNDTLKIDFSKPELADFTSKNPNFSANYQQLCKVANIMPHPSIPKPPKDSKETANSKESLNSARPETSLRIKGFLVDTPTWSLMLLGMKASAALTALNLVDTSLSTSQFMQLVYALKSTNITSLSLDWCAIRPDSPADSSEEDHSIRYALILSPDTKLTELSLRGNHITPEGAVELARAIEKINSLQILNLFKNDIDDAGASAIWKCLRINNTLKQLSLSYNRLTSTTLKEAADTLTQFELTDEEVEERVALEKQLSEAGKQKKPPTAVGKSPSKKPEAPKDSSPVIPLPHLSPEGVWKCQGNTGLKELNLKGNSFDSAAVESLNHRLSHPGRNPPLQLLI